MESHLCPTGPTAQEGSLFKQYHLEMVLPEARVLIKRLESLDVVSEVVVENLPPEDKFRILVGFSGVVDYRNALLIVHSVMTQFFASRGGIFKDCHGDEFHPAFALLTTH